MITIKLPRGEWTFNPETRLGAKGGFGEVFAGVASDNSPIAIKRLYLKANELAHRELKVADLLIGKTATNIVPIFDAGQDANSDCYYIVMARADRSLQDELNSRKSLPPAEAIDVMMQIAAGMVEAVQIVHRDLKPANVLRHEDRWKLADFGIARFVEESTSIETLKGCLSPPYAAPEQWNLKHTSPAVDVYALGCIAHALIAGAPPFTGPSTEDYRRQHTTTAPPELPCDDGRLKTIVSMMLRKTPEARPAVARVLEVLKTIASAAAPPRVGAAALTKVAAIEAGRASEAEARAADMREAAEHRKALATDGQVVFRGLMDQFIAAAKSALGAAIAHDGQAIRLALGDASLNMHSARFFSTTPLEYSQWDAILLGEIVVRQPNPDWSHGASLWYMRKQGAATEYRWLEVSFKDLAVGRATVLQGPYAITKDFRNADMALGPGLHLVDVESGPTPIDGENAEAFIDRWLHRLAQAYEGRLRPF